MALTEKEPLTLQLALMITQLLTELTASAYRVIIGDLLTLPVHLVSEWRHKAALGKLDLEQAADGWMILTQQLIQRGLVGQEHSSGKVLEQLLALLIH